IEQHGKQANNASNKSESPHLPSSSWSKKQPTYALSDECILAEIAMQKVGRLSTILNLFLRLHSRLGSLG
ncbi:MAG: hypothetical protein WAK26_04095, partial [Terracidiphilus sp.]